MIKKIHKEILRDKRLAKLVRKVGPIDSSVWKHPRNTFHSLLRSIIHQQVSGAAATSIEKKLKKLFRDRFPTPAQVLAASERKLHGAGLSGQKVQYVRDLAEKFANGTIATRKFPKMSNDEIIKHLVRVKGIGVWTAHMFLLFTLKRPDILPTLDLGIRKGFMEVYNLSELPDHDTMERIAQGWRAHASYASLYLWRASDEIKNRQK
jgi:DNA-3-methyladenine glycosylase II